MLTKYSDKFESIFYAVLYSNLSDNILMAKNFNNGKTDLFANEPYVDIDRVNFAEILNKHNERFGEIKWLNEKGRRFNQFKNDINLILRYYHDYKYEIIIQVIKLAIKYGLNNIENTEPKKVFNRYIEEITTELNTLAFANLRIFPLNIRKEKFMIVHYNTENKIADLLYNRLCSKYLGYKIILKDKNSAYFSADNKIWYIDINEIESPVNLSFEKIWESLYAKIKNLDMLISGQDGLLKKSFSWIKAVSFLPS